MHHIVAAAQERDAQTKLILEATFRFVVFLGIYLLPWGIAQHRHVARSGRVLLVNLLTGWTVVGWVVAMVMAVRPPAGAAAARHERAITFVAAVPAATTVAAGWYPDPWGQARVRYHDGAQWTGNVSA